jgi:3D (Asp-Asp-Asp) domain-containing protein/peptidoglycan hydrolase CwlO-like protein
VRTGCLRAWTRAAAASLVVLAAFVAVTSARADDPADLLSEAERLRAQSGGLASERQAALLELYALETRLAGAERRARALGKRLSEAEGEATSLERRLESARADSAEAERRLAHRLRMLYVEGEVDPIAVLLGAESLDDALTALDGLGRVATQDVAILEQVTEARRALKDSLRELAVRRAELRRLEAQARQERSELAAARAEKSAYVAELERRSALNDRLVSDLTAQAEAASAQPSAGGSSGPGNPGRPPADGTRMTVVATAYCLKGTTATGIPTGWGVVAVDPAVIPLGTKMWIPGYGNGVAADTGAAVRGAMIDVWFPECSQAIAWGRKVVTITIR